MALKFECTKCGKCCFKRGPWSYFPIKPDEVKAAAKYKGMSVEDFKEKFTEVQEQIRPLAKALPGVGDAFRDMKTVDDHCIFLVDNQCSIYPVRPEQCQTYPFWDEFIKDGEWTDQILELCEGTSR